MRPPGRGTPLPVAYLALIMFAVFYLGLAVINHYFFRSYCFDYATYNFAFYDYAHGRISACTLYPTAGSGSFFQDHFSLTLFVFAPFYWLFGWLLGTYTLLLLQWCLVVYGGWMTYKLIALKSGNAWFSVLAMVYYFVLLGRLNATTADCNFAIIGSALVPAFLYYFEKGRLLPLSLCFIFLLINREDFSLWMIFICGFLMILHRKDKLMLKRATILFSLSFFFFSVLFLLIIPAIEDEHKQYTLFNFAVLGKTPGEALAYLVHDPVRVVQLLFVNHSKSVYYEHLKPEFYMVYLLSGAGVLLLRPAYLLPLLPLLAKKMYNDFPYRWGIGSYYSVEIVSILPILVFLVLLQLGAPRIRMVIAGFICCAALCISLFKISTPDLEHPALNTDQSKINFMKRSFYTSPIDVPALQKALGAIPATAAVSASGVIAPHLALRKKIYFFPRIDDAEFICVIKKGDNWPITQESFDQKLQELVQRDGWNVKNDHRDFLILGR